MNEKKWWKCYPRLEYECQALEQAGIKHSIDEDAFEKGIVRLVLPETVAGKMFAVFPDLYPYFRFELYAPELNLPHHQNPFEKNLCMIERATDNWDQDDTVASFIMKRLPEVLKAGKSNNKKEVETIEGHQAEPLSNYYRCLSNTSIITDGSWVIEEQYNSGALIIGTRMVNMLTDGWAVIEIHDEHENVLASANQSIKRMYSNGNLTGRWIKLNAPPLFYDNRELFNHLQVKDQFPHKIKRHSIKGEKGLPGGKLTIRAAVFPEETHAWRESNQGWLFINNLHVWDSYGKK